MRRAVLLAALALAGCGGADEEREARPAAATTEVTVRVQPGERRTITCPGDDLCRRLRRADFSPTPDTVACTEIYGGDATATVVGTVGPKELDARFSLQNGCEIARWKQFAWLLGDPPSGTP